MSRSDEKHTVDFEYEPDSDLYTAECRMCSWSAVGSHEPYISDLAVEHENETS